jgi:hypothetical protein
MHSTRALLCGLVAVSLLATAACSRYAQNSKARKAGKPAPEAAWQADCKGFGRTQAEAVENALLKAAGELKKHLAQRDPPVLWLAPTDQLRRYLEAGESRRLADQEVGNPEVGATIPTQGWSVQVTLTPEKFRDLTAAARRQPVELEQQRRDARAEERLGMAARVLAVLVALLAAVAVYIRLDDWTGGVYTRWLRVALLAVAAGGAGLWLLA